MDDNQKNDALQQPGATENAAAPEQPAAAPEAATGGADAERV